MAKKTYAPFNEKDFNATINSLLEQDRIEIREIKGKLFNISYYVILAYVAAFALLFTISAPGENGNFRNDINFWLWSLLIGCSILFIFYCFVFSAFNKNLKHVRRCLDLRELFIEDYDDFTARQLSPIGKTDNVPANNFKDAEHYIGLVAVIAFYIFIAFVFTIKICHVYCNC